MDVQQREDAAAFVAETSDLLLRAPARHNLMLGICDLLLRRPEVYPTFHLWTVLGAGRVVGAALRMPPHNLVVAAPLEEGAIPAIAGEIRRTGAALPGVVGAVPETAAFAQGGPRPPAVRRALRRGRASTSSERSAGGAMRGAHHGSRRAPTWSCSLAGTRTSWPRRCPTTSATPRCAGGGWKERSTTASTGSGKTRAADRSTRRPRHVAAGTRRRSSPT